MSARAWFWLLALLGGGEGVRDVKLIPAGKLFIRAHEPARPCHTDARKLTDRAHFLLHFGGLLNQHYRNAEALQVG